MTDKIVTEAMIEAAARTFFAVTADQIGKAGSSYNTLPESAKDKVRECAKAALEAAMSTAQPALDDDAELWAVLYLHDWDPPKDGKQPVYPEIHGVFSTWQEAEAEAKSRLSPEKYSVRRAKNFTRANRLLQAKAPMRIVPADPIVFEE